MTHSSKRPMLDTSYHRRRVARRHQDPDRRATYEAELRNMYNPDSLSRIRDTLQRLVDKGADKEDLIILLAQLEFSRASNPEVMPDTLDILEGWVSPHMEILPPPPITPEELDQRRVERAWIRARSIFAKPNEDDNIAKQIWQPEPNPSLRQHAKPELPPIIRRRDE